MTLRTRRIIMITFILAFFTLAPIIIFYSSGYRLDIKRVKIIKTGTLMIEADNIKDANLYIDNKLHEELFDEKIFIYNLLPGEYQVRLEKEGYHQWEKKVTINSSLTTFAKDVILFKKNLPLQLIEGNVTDFFVSPDKQKIVYILETNEFLELYLYDLNTKNNNLIYRIGSGYENISVQWAASSKKILAGLDSNYLVFDINNLQQGRSINKIIGFQPTTIKWDINSDNIIYILYNDSIYSLDLIFAKLDKVFFSTREEPLYPEFFIEANDIFYILRQEQRDSLYKYNLNFQTDKNVLELSKSDNYQFIKSSNNYLNLLDQDNQKLYLIQKVITDLEIEINGGSSIQEFTAKDALWDDKENQILIYDDFEIKTFNTGTERESFINRYGQEITQINWHPSLQYLVILIEDSIKIIDLNLTNGTRNTTEIISFDQLNNLSIDKKGENIYFNGQIGKQQGLYEIEINK
ncbi:PEGA domain-containing protein [Patescibacteria group bacterium]